ncbi:TIGR03087 family PEP-CTERM/XrtA system glycosyltransferase [Catenovulum sediminis]|uniref:TIGR03087 family PEP-CTERM/XrtA system glycosyltransferase n=1 Tax=Catenovulum sediminis TaxID=1740262 RepID=UPI00117DE290|nr:TIGR03087 family PEP-CTERM/XrtA system glycosyltransferase [Catenovulum sediminis]
MEPILYLCHRIPFPPNKGDKIRSFNILKYLSAHYEVHLGAFVDDESDWQYHDELKKYCKSTCLLPMSKKRSTLKGLTAFISGTPITVPYYADWQMKTWVKQLITYETDLDKAVIFSSSMAQYVDNEDAAYLTKVIDFVDVDSDKWRQYAESKKGLMRFVYHREYKKLAKYEKYICQSFQASIFVSPQEAKHFRQQLPEAEHGKVHSILNGVDTKYFNSAADDIPNIENKTPCICFTGAMDYWANADAVIWFAHEVWPTLKQKLPELTFYIVGGNPTAEVAKLAEQDGIEVTGRVADVRPYIQSSFCSVAPMRIARGIQNKVLEAMSMTKPLVMTSMAAEGIDIPTQQSAFIIDDAEKMVQAILEIYKNPELAKQLGQTNRKQIEDNYQWQAVLAPLTHLISE